MTSSASFFRRITLAAGNGREEGLGLEVMGVTKVS